MNKQTIGKKITMGLLDASFNEILRIPYSRLSINVRYTTYP